MIVIVIVIVTVMIMMVVVIVMMVVIMKVVVRISLSSIVCCGFENKITSSLLQPHNKFKLFSGEL